MQYLAYFFPFLIQNDGKCLSSESSWGDHLLKQFDGGKGTTKNDQELRSKGSNLLCSDKACMAELRELICEKEGLAWVGSRNRGLLIKDEEHQSKGRDSAA